MKQQFFLLFFYIITGNAVSQERYYCELSKKTPALFKIDANNVSNYNSDTLNFTIQSLILLKPKMFWGKSSIERLKIANDVIYAVDKNRLHLFLYSLQGNPVNKIDLTKYDKNAKITNYRIYNDTLYIIDKQSLFLFKFTREGELISNNLLTFNFEDFCINKQGIYFISKHEESRKKNKVRITLFDHSLNLLKQYFISGPYNELYLKPRFYSGKDEVLFSISDGNQIYILEKDKVCPYLQVNNKGTILNYAHILGFHSFQYLSEKQTKKIVNSYYFNDQKLNDGIVFPTFLANDLTVFLFNGILCGDYRDSFISFIKMDSDFVSTILKMEWEDDHKYIKNDLLDVIRQIEKNKETLVVMYKILSH